MFPLRLNSQKIDLTVTIHFDDYAFLKFILGHYLFVLSRYTLVKFDGMRHVICVQCGVEKR